MTVEQARALSVEQALAFRAEQLRSMSPATSDFIEALRNFTPPRDDDNSTDTTPDSSERPTAAPGPVRAVTTESPDDNVRVATTDSDVDNDIVTAVRSGVTVNSRAKQDTTASSDDRATRPPPVVTPDVVVQTRAPPNDDDGNNWRPPPPPPPPDDGWFSNYDPFQFQSQIDALVDALPDSITPQNVDQFIAVLSQIPAADIVSKLSASAVSRSTTAEIIHCHYCATRCVNNNDINKCARSSGSQTESCH